MVECLRAKWLRLRILLLSLKQVCCLIVPPPFLLEEGEELSVSPNFLEVGCWKRGIDFFQGGYSFYIKNKLKSEIFNVYKKKVYEQKCFSVITKNLNWEVLIKNLVTAKRWDAVKDETFSSGWYFYWYFWEGWVDTPMHSV